MQQVASILNDPHASSNDKYVALQLLRNAEVSAKGVLPNCQDTGTATIVASKGQQIWTGGNDAEALSKGIYTTFQENNLRFSQNAPLDMFTEVNTQNQSTRRRLISAPSLVMSTIFSVLIKGAALPISRALSGNQIPIATRKTDRILIEKMKSLGTAACRLTTSPLSSEGFQPIKP
ncbi:class I fumarate hydratase [Escherichia coli]|nr:class I fumarate hydratase [Escherichia coli]